MKFDIIKDNFKYVLSYYGIHTIKVLRINEYIIVLSTESLSPIYMNMRLCNPFYCLKYVLTYGNNL